MGWWNLTQPSSFRWRRRDRSRIQICPRATRHLGCSSSEISSPGHCRAVADTRRRRIRWQQHATESRHRFDQRRSPIWSYFSRDDRQSDSAVACARSYDRILSILDLDRRPNTLLVFLETPNRNPWRAVLGRHRLEAQIPYQYINSAQQPLHDSCGG